MPHFPMPHVPHRPSGHRAGQRRRATAALLLLAGVLAAPLAACSKLLEVDAPQLIEESTLQQPANASVIVAGAVADFECAFAAYTATMGTVADELADAQANAATWDLDRRTNSPATGLYTTAGCGSLGGSYTPVSTARYAADNAVRLLEKWTDAEVPNRQVLIARASAYAGYALILLGEGFCSAAIDLGPELKPAQVFDLAEQRFTKAITAATAAGGAAGDSIRYLALVGRARSKIDRNKKAEAAADAALVPNGFTFNARYSSATGRSENRVFRINNTSGSETVDPSYRNLTFGGVPDPRVPVVDAGRSGSLATVRLWAQQKYKSLTDPIPIASWREALLIRAEAAADAGNASEAVGFINQLHARVNIPPFQSTDIAAIRSQVIEERRRELFLESHRLYDTIRFNVPLTPAPGTPFANGGGTYGNDKCLLLPDVERLNNPNIPRSG